MKRRPSKPADDAAAAAWDDYDAKVIRAFLREAADYLHQPHPMLNFGDRSGRQIIEWLTDRLPPSRGVRS